MSSQECEGVIHNLETGVCISVGNSERWSFLEQLLKPGQKRGSSVANLHFCHCCDKNYKFCIGQTDVVRSSSFEGNPLYWGEWWDKVISGCECGEKFKQQLEEEAFAKVPSELSFPDMRKGFSGPFKEPKNIIHRRMSENIKGIKN